MIYKETLTFTLSISIFGLIFLILSIPNVMFLALEKKQDKFLVIEFSSEKNKGKITSKIIFPHGRVVFGF